MAPCRLEIAKNRVLRRQSQIWLLIQILNPSPRRLIDAQRLSSGKCRSQVTPFDKSPLFSNLTNDKSRLGPIDSDVGRVWLDHKCKAVVHRGGIPDLGGRSRHLSPD